ncbi:MAG: hypothetical protein H7Y08_03840 [Rhizobiaceae bacterium]|nr:hypothetical protein [Rhizobiaceae bacterium]
MLPLGLPQDIDGTSCVAALFRVGPDALDGARIAAGVSEPQVVHKGPRRDFITGRVWPDDGAQMPDARDDADPQSGFLL